MTRLQAVAALCPEAPVVVDIGADHGRLASMIGAIATERMPHRRAGAGRWVIADGLRPVRVVDVAVICGMGGHRIISILSEAPAPRVGIVAQPNEHDGHLRVWLAGHGFRIDTESLVEERGRMYAVIRAVPGLETATGMALRFGPRLLEARHPLLERWLTSKIEPLQEVKTALEQSADTEAQRTLAYLCFLEQQRIALHAP